MMIPIALVFLIRVVIIVVRGLYFLRLRINTEPQQMLDLMQQGKVPDALVLAEKRQNQILQTLATGITYRTSSPEKAMASSGLEEIGSMKYGLPDLDTVITLGPLLGLLRTIVGMIDSFEIMASDGLGQPHAVTGGVSETLICTAAGIFMAVTILIPYTYSLTRVEHQPERIEYFATQAEAALIKNGNIPSLSNQSPVSLTSLGITVGTMMQHPHVFSASFGS